MEPPLTLDEPGRMLMGMIVRPLRVYVSPVFRRIGLMLLAAVVTLASPALPAGGQDAPATPEVAVTDRVAPVWDGTYRRIRVPILMYHYVSPLPENADEYRRELTISPDTFRAHLEYLFFEGFTPISLYDLDEALLTGRELPAKPVVLTFDDGYIDHYTHVFPLLKQYGFTGTFFIITGRVDARDPNYVSWEQVGEMAAAGMDMEPHTKNHVSLQGRDYDFLVYEMLGSIESIKAHTGRQPHLFSYPVGQYDADTLAVARTLPIWRAVTTANGRYHTTDNRLEMPRVRITGGMSAPALASVLRGD
ncbi:MAG: polysaccharide deacetylase family protein [Chloroflexota bacterium]